MRILSSTLLALAIAVSSAWGQEQTLKTTIVTYAPGPLPAGFTAFFDSGGEILPFKANAAGLGEPVRYEGKKRFVLRESVEAFGVPPEQAKPPIAFVDLPEKSDNILILAADVGGGKIRLIAYDVAMGNLKGGDYKVFNFSNSTISMIMGPQKFVLKPAEDRMVKDPAWAGEVQAFPLQIATVSADNKAVMVKNVFWEHWPTKRQIMFLFDGRRKGEPIGFMCFNVEPPLGARAPAPQ